LGDVACVAVCAVAATAQTTTPRVPSFCVGFIVYEAPGLVAAYNEDGECVGEGGRPFGGGILLGELSGDDVYLSG
jgi:hypothetical protein